MKMRTRHAERLADPCARHSLAEPPCETTFNNVGSGFLGASVQAWMARSLVLRLASPVSCACGFCVSARPPRGGTFLINVLQSSALAFL